MLKPLLAGFAFAAMLALGGPAHLGAPTPAQAVEDGSFQAGTSAYLRGDYVTAMGIWRALAEAGDAAAQFNLGIMHDMGDGVARDPAEAVRWYRLAVAQGDGFAAYNLGLMYDRGEGVAMDVAEAVRWYRIAGEMGDVPAQYRLGGIYAEGRGVPQDYAEAARWYGLAAEGNHVAAQLSLGALYANGRGVPLDPGRALEWFDRAEHTSCMWGEDPPRRGPRLGALPQPGAQPHHGAH